MIHDNNVVMDGNGSSIDPWTWNEDRVEIYQMNGACLMQLTSNQISFLSKHYNYPRLVGRLSALQQLYKRVVSLSNIEDNSRTETIDKCITFNNLPDQNTINSNNNYQVCTVTYPSDFIDTSDDSDNIMTKPFRSRYCSSLVRGDRLLDLRSDYVLAATSKFTIQRLCVALIFCLFGFLFCSYMIVLADERRPPRDIFPPLPDIFLDNVKRVTWATAASEVIIVLLITSFLVTLLIRYDRLIILKRCCLMLAMLYTFRGITVYCTSLSVVGKHLTCYPKTVNITSAYGRFHRLMASLTSQGLQINGSQTCGDYIFSGHTCIIVLLSHFITFYTPRRLWFLKLMIWSISVFAILCILAAHFHYTVDVVLAVVIAYGLFVYYNAICRCKSMFDENTKSRMVVYIPAFYFFESKETCSIDYDDGDDMLTIYNGLRMSRTLIRHCRQFLHSISKKICQQSKTPMFFENL
ncbi:hypothetical protein GJ496_005861 [Pomphorhynchus laevis]|nr:hypothetical protein GJ496_005861 [Pomphorhynchus laevis]